MVWLFLIIMSLRHSNQNMPAFLKSIDFSDSDGALKSVFCKWKRKLICMLDNLKIEQNDVHANDMEKTMCGLL